MSNNPASDQNTSDLPRDASEHLTSNAVILAAILQVCQLIQAAYWPAVICFGFVCLRGSVEVLAGKETTANIAANLVLDWGLDMIVAYTVGAGGVGYGLYERGIRKKTAAALRDEQIEYERLADPMRETSGLLPGGEMP